MPQPVLLSLVDAFNRGEFEKSIVAWRCEECTPRALVQKTVTSVASNSPDVVQKRKAPYSIEGRPVWPPVRKKKKVADVPILATNKKDVKGKGRGIDVIDEVLLTPKYETWDLKSSVGL